MVRLYIIRHADPDYETERERGGTITAHGRSEALALGPFLKREGITHAYSSPLGRALDTAKLATGELPNIQLGLEPWAKELSAWRQRPLNSDQSDLSAENDVSNGVTDKNSPTSKNKTKKLQAVWDYPAGLIRNELKETTSGINTSCPGWTHVCLDHAAYLDSYREFCKLSDEFLLRHGLLRESGMYTFTGDQTQERGDVRIAVFMHHGSGVTWLSHLLGIPLPLAHAAFWLAPSSVTTVLFDENMGQHPTDGIIKMAPRALCVGGLQHLAAAGLDTINSVSQEWKRPAGIKCNFW